MNLKLFVSFTLGILLTTISWLFLSGFWQDTFYKVSVGLIIAWLIDVIIFLITNREKWRLYTTLVWKRNQRVRVTIAYLFRIEINGSYILIKRHKQDRPGYQPVGGAFKYFKEETRDLFDDFGVVPCHFVLRDEDTDHDLRIQLKKRKNLLKFLEWFESRKGREVDPWREFYEELIEPGLLPHEHFKHIKYVFIGKHMEGIFPATVFPIEEFRYAEIYELRPETDAQRKAICDLLNQPEKIVFAKPEEIYKGHTDTGKPILPHTFKILPK